MRIIAGAHRGKRLAHVGTGDRAAHLRPTSDRVRETIFNLLQNGGYGDPVADATVLDLFAGTGALGLEALSRGAAHATFVDDGIKARGLLRENIALCQAQGVTKVFRRDATRLGVRQGPTFDLVFLDPPYGKGLGERGPRGGGRRRLDCARCHRPFGRRWTACLPPPAFTRLDTRRYGDTWITILGYDGPNPEDGP